MKKSNFIKKTLILGIVAIIIFGCYLFDLAIANSYSIFLVSVTPENPPADGRTKVEITVQLQRGDIGVEGHSLLAFITFAEGTEAGSKSGEILVNTLKTDSDGTATFIWVPYASGVYTPVQPVKFYVLDESNSVIFEINVKYAFIIEMS